MTPSKEPAKYTKTTKSLSALGDLFSVGGVTMALPIDARNIVENGFKSLRPEEAAAILEQCRYEKQARDKTSGGQKHIQVLAEIMRRKEWRMKDVINFALLNGKLILVNGHHRLAAQALADETIVWTFLVHECKTADEVAALYATFDTNLRIRSNQNILAAADVAARMGIGSTTAEALYRAMPLIEANFALRRGQNNAIYDRIVGHRVQRMESFQREVLLFEEAIAPAPLHIKKRLRSQGAMAVALMTFRHQPTDAAEFWRGVAENDGLRKGDPRNTYIRTITEHSYKVGDAASLTARLAALAWNAFFERRQATALKPNGTNGVFRIAGTPIKVRE